MTENGPLIANVTEWQSYRHYGMSAYRHMERCNINQ